MQTSNSYWLYLEPYTNLTIKQDSFIIYNTLSGEYVERKDSSKLTDIVNELDKEDNLWCIEFNESKLNDNEIFIFISEIRNKYIGDIIETSLSEGKPFQFKPILNIQQNLQKKLEINGVMGGEVMGYLNELTFYLNSECDLNCDLCNYAVKQYHFCSKNKSNIEFNIDLFQNIIKQSYNSGLNKINLTGGNLFKYSKIESVLEIVNKRNIAVDIYVHYWNINSCNLIKLSNLITLKILIVPPFKQIFISEILQRLSSFCTICFTFIISSEIEYESIEMLITSFPDLTYEVLPLYNSENIDFFKSYVFLEKEDIFSNILSNKEIFRNQVLNSNDFGKLTIMPDGSVYANINRNSLGNVDQYSLSELIYKELKQGESWLKIRNNKPCTICLYQWLCPSPSNYEQVIGKSNLCNIKP